MEFPSNLTPITNYQFPSFLDHLGKPLEQYLSKLQKVRLIRAKERLGLIKARSVAMDEARASTITILDSQCECYPGKVYNW